MSYAPGDVLLGKLRVEGVIGSGAMGTVYEVEHLLTKHRRALKVLHPELTRRGSAVSRFVREASVAGRLGSRRVVETFDAGQLDDGSPYVLMELLRGRSLADAIAHGPMAPARAARIVRQACEGIAAAHDAGIVHRDLKPANIFLAGADEEVKILDFGVSKFGADTDSEGKVTAEGTVIGTPFYMSPEQATGRKDVDARTDVYALGVILYELLSGELPYSEDSLLALIAKISTGSFDALRVHVPELEPELERVVHRALDADREKRFSSVRELSDALAPHARDPLRDPIDPRAIKTSHSVDVHPLEETLDAEGARTLRDEPRAVPPPPPRKRSWLGVWLAGALMVAVGVAIWIVSAGQERVVREHAPVRERDQPPHVPLPSPVAAGGETPALAPRVEPPSEPSHADPPPRPRHERSTKAGLRTSNPYGEE